jgi:hypothetical protein
MSANEQQSTWNKSNLIDWVVASVVIVIILSLLAVSYLLIRCKKRQNLRLTLNSHINNDAVGFRGDSNQSHSQLHNGGTMALDSRPANQDTEYSAQEDPEAQLQTDGDNESLAKAEPSSPIFIAPVSQTPEDLIAKPEPNHNPFQSFKQVWMEHRQTQRSKKEESDQKQALQDKRAAAGYESAYRG